MTAPRHAQPSSLATLGWAAGLRWTVIVVLAALALGAAATLGTAPRRAAAGVPAPVVDSTAATELSTSASSTAASSSAAASSTVASPSVSESDNKQASSLASDGIPATALQAYQDAARREDSLDPTCGLSWPLLAGIGRVESDHGRFGGAVLHTDGISTPRVIGIPLDGNGTARITDTDHGRLDGDTVYDRAVGPMQFIPSTWAGYRADGNGDGVADPFNIFDATAAAADYLCSAGGNLTTLAGQLRAVRAYNDSDAYIALVLQLERVYASGVPGLTVPILPPNPTPPKQHAPVPPVNPGPPLGTPRHPKKKPTRTPTSATHSPSKSPTGSSCPTPSDTTTPTDTPTGTPSTSASSSTSTSTSGSTCPTPSQSETSPTGSASTSTSQSSSSTSSGTSTGSSTGGSGASSGSG